MTDAKCPLNTAGLMAATFDTTVYPWWWKPAKRRKLTNGYFALYAFEVD